VAGSPAAPAPDALRAAAALCSAHPGPTPLYMSGATGNGESVRSGPSHPRRGGDDLVRPCAISWAPIPSTTSRRVDPMASAYRWSSRSRCSNWAADPGLEAVGTERADRHRRRARRAPGQARIPAADIYRNLTRFSGSWSPATPAAPIRLDYLSPVFNRLQSSSTATASTWTIPPSWVLGGGWRGCQVIVIGHQKGPRHHEGESQAQFSGCPTPRATQGAPAHEVAAKFNAPLITSSSTPRAYPGLARRNGGSRRRCAGHSRDVGAGHAGRRRRARRGRLGGRPRARRGDRI